MVNILAITIKTHVSQCVLRKSLLISKIIFQLDRCVMGLSNLVNMYKIVDLELLRNKSDQVKK